MTIVYTVSFSVPVEGKSYRINRSATVMAPNAARAIELISKHYPDNRIHNLTNAGQHTKHDIIVDDCCKDQVLS